MAKKPVNMKQLLKQVNAIRVAFGNEPLSALLPGKTGDSFRCPIALSLANGWMPDVTDTISMSYEGKELTLERGIEICKRLTAQGFVGVRLYQNSVQLYPRIGLSDVEWADAPDEIVIPMTQTMQNFVYRFDEGDFEELIKGRNGNSVL